MLNLIVACDQKNAIGKDNSLPWHLPNDLKHFKKLTTGNVVVMGRKTYESIGKPLPNRINIILTRDHNFKAEGCLIYNSIKDLLNDLTDNYLDRSVFVIGGSEIYQQFFPIADRIYLTRIHHTFDGDAYFPKLNYNEWKVTSHESGILDKDNVHVHTFFVYDRPFNFSF